DVKAFEEAVAEEDYATALRLYGGDLMPGFFIPGVPEFERWLEDERVRLRRAAHGAAGKRAELAEREGDAMEAAEWARRAVAMALDDEVVVQRSIRLLDRQGDRLGAIEVFEQLARYLREEYGAEPSPETQRLIAEVRAREEPVGTPGAGGARAGPRAPSIRLTEVPRAAPPEPEPARAPAVGPAPAASSAEPTGIASLRRSRLATASAAAGVLLVCAAGTVGLMRLTRVGGWQAGGGSERPAVMVAPFQNLSVNPEHRYLAAAITEAVTAQLAEVNAIELRVRDPESRAASTDAWLGAGGSHRQALDRKS